MTQGVVQAENGAESDASPPVPAPCVVGRVGARPTPILTNIQRERAEMLAIFESPHNLPLLVYAKLAGKSRDQVNRDIQKRRLLSLPFGNRGHRIPEWQLDPVQLQLTQALLERMPSVDPWMLRCIRSRHRGLLVCSSHTVLARRVY
jgi:hypothetical protein